MKKIDTLVDDIYALISKGMTTEEIEANEKAFTDFSNHLVDTVKKSLSIERRKKQREMFFSMLGYPLRKAWYYLKGYPEEALLPHTRIKFFFGDMVEAYALLLAKLSGHEVKGEQDKLSLDEAKGRRDAVIDGHTVDVKSASKYAFERFKSGLTKKTDSFGYIDQLAAYTISDPGVDQSRAFFLAVGKELGHLQLSEVSSSSFPDTRRKIEEIKTALKNTTPPDFCYEPVPHNKSGNYALSVECSYCPFKQECWKKSNNGKGLRTFLYSTGPVHFVHVEKQPDVPEITGRQ